MNTTYPNHPGAKAPGTSQEAANAERGMAATLRQIVRTLLQEHGPATADECALTMNESVLAVRPRLSELVKMGNIEKDGDNRRKNASGHSAQVWRVVITRKQMEMKI